MHKNVAIILALGLISVQLEATDYTWTGNAGNGEWTNANNWTGVGIPGASDNATIGGGVAVTVPAGPGDFSIGGLSLSGNLDIQRTGVITISGLVSVSGTIKSSGDISFLSAITLTGNSTLEFDGGSVSFGGVISGAHILTIRSTSNTARIELGSIRVSGLLLDADTPVSQSTGTSIIDAAGGYTCRLQVEGPGPFTLDESGNQIGTIAVDTASDFGYRGSGAVGSTLNIGELDLANTGTSITGIDTGGSLSFFYNGNLVVNADIRARSLSNIFCLSALFGDVSFTIETGRFSFFSPIELEGNAQMVALNGDVELEKINNTDGTNANSLTVSAINNTITLFGAIGETRPIGDLTLEAASSNTTSNISLDGNLTINTGTLAVSSDIDINVDGSLTGTGGMEITGSADVKVGKDLTIANFTADTSTLTLDKNTTASLGSGNENTYTLLNLTIDKQSSPSTSYGRVSAVGPMRINGYLNIIRGTLGSGSETIVVVGNMTVTALGRFEGGSGTVRFIQSNSVLEPYGGTFNNLEVVDSHLDIQNSDFTAGGWVRIESEINPAQLEFIRGSHSATIANLILEGRNSPVVDFTNWNFNIGSSQNNEDGEIRLTGEQTTQAFAYDGANKERMGLVSYYDGNGAGTILHENFWNLEIDASGQIINLVSDIYINGYYDPNSNKTLDTPVSEVPLVGLHLRSGTLNTANHRIILHGSYIRTDTVVISGELRLTLLGNYPSYIGGNNDFSEFICEDTSVWGKILYFQSGKTTRVISNARFAIRGSGDYSPGGPLNLSSLFFPSPRSYVYVLSSQPDDATHYWNFNRIQSTELELEFVYLLHSNAFANPQVRPVNVTFQDCPNWLSPPYVSLSWTKDLGDLTGAAVHNGRIDKILVESNSDLNMVFDGLEIEVEGYEVEGFQPHGVNANHFYIELEEQDYLDTSATPRWRFIQNESLRDTTHGFELRLYDGGEAASNAKVYETPYDDAAPIIGYTLAIADKNEIFIHFSEPVVDLSSSSIEMGDFSTTAGSGLVSLRRVSGETHSGMRELVLTTSSSISASDILSEVEIVAGAELRDIPSPMSTHASDSADAVDTAVGLVNSTHRISDLGLGLVGNGLMEPISARGSITPVSGKIGVVSSFAWNDFLPADDFSLIVHRYTGITEDPRLVYSSSATAEVKNGRLWLPIFGENAALARNFSGLVSRPHIQTLTKLATSSSNDNYTYQFEAPDEMIRSGRDLEFVFHFVSSGLYCAQVLDDTASNWYRQVLPWAIRIRDVALQAGNVSILNNILNPINNDETSMYYELGSAGVVTIQVFDLSGDTVAVLQRGFQSAGKYTVSWDGRNGAGNPVARGIYFVRLVGPDKMDQIRKVLVVK